MFGGDRYRPAMNAVLLILAAAVVLPPRVTADASAERNSRVQRIETSVLAPCCYTEPVSTHQSEIALKMRIEIAKWVSEGKTNQEILDTYVERYGARVLVDPRTIPGRWTPWVPWLTVVCAVLFGFWILRRWHANIPVASPASGPELAALPDIEDEE